MALRAALRDALSCEIRTRAAERRATVAEQRAAAAEAEARISEQRVDLVETMLSEAERELRHVRRERRTLLSAVSDVAHGNFEAAIRTICCVADGALSTEGEDGWTCDITMIHPGGSDTLAVCTYWEVRTLKAIIAERYMIPVMQQCLMHAGMQLEDHHSLNDLDLFDPAHNGELPVFIVSPSTTP